MTNYEQIQLLEKVKNEMDPVMEILHEINKLMVIINEQNKIILTTTYVNKFNSDEIKSAKNKIVSAANNFATTFDMVNTIGLANTFKTNIRNLTKDGVIDILGNKNIIIDLSDKLLILATKIYDYIGKRNVTLIYDFNIFFNELYGEINSLYNYITNIVEKNSIKDITYDNNEISELTISYNMISNNIEDYIQYLNTINIVYTNVSHLIGININDENKLKVVKIESGSFFEKLFGLEKVIDLIVYIIKKIADNIFRKFTIEGKISTLNELIILLNNDNELIAKYEVDTKNKKEDIELIHGIIVKSVQKMVQKTTGIKINNKMINIDEHIKEKYIQENKKLMIDSNTKNNNK